MKKGELAPTEKTKYSTCTYLQEKLSKTQSVHIKLSSTQNSLLTSPCNVTPRVILVFEDAGSRDESWPLRFKQF